MIPRLSEINEAIKSSNNPEIKRLRTDFIIPLQNILSPLLELVTAIEGQHISLADILPTLLIAFNKLELI
jgi:hypothetical protein